MKLLSLLKFDIKQNWGIFSIILGILLLYLLIFINMFDPNGLEKLQAIANLKMPPELLKAFGYEIETNASLISLVASFFYKMIVYFILIIYVIIVGNRLVVDHVNKGSMSYLLSSPHTRKSIVLTQSLFFLISIAIMIITLILSGIIAAETWFPGYLNIKAFITLNLGIFLVFSIFSGISFLASCIFNESKNALSLGAGLPLAFILINILGNSSESLDFLHYFTVISFINTDNIIAGTDILLPFSIMTLLAFGLYSSGIWLFYKRNLSI